MKIIIKSGNLSWSGKEFSVAPAKMYSNFDDAVMALNSYHFYKYVEHKGYIPCAKKQIISFIHLSENQVDKMIIENKVRF